MKEKGKRSEAVQELKSSVDPQLHQEAEKLGRLITRVEVISKKLLQMYNKVYYWHGYTQMDVKLI